MDLTIFLAQLFGIYSIIGGLAVIARRRYFIPVIGGFAEERLTRLFVAILELLAGLAIVLSHNVWSTLPESIISLFGWGLALEGTFYLLASDELVESLFRKLNTQLWYTAGGLLSIIIGLYLTAVGFSFI